MRNHHSITGFSGFLGLSSDTWKFGWLFGSFQTWNFLNSTATPWTDVNFVDDQFLRTLGNHPFLFFRFWWYLSE
ncbi:unnamed protein product [Rhizophagus irregularis]|nr:unnamed protein product [Rhizophagus irregularis]